MLEIQSVLSTTAFHELLLGLSLQDLDIMVTGDMNVDLLSDTNTAYHMLNSAREVGLKQVIREATRVTEKSSSLLDHFYVPNNNNYLVSGTFKLNF